MTCRRNKLLTPKLLSQRPHVKFSVFLADEGETEENLLLLISTLLDIFFAIFGLLIPCLSWFFIYLRIIFLSRAPVVVITLAFKFEFGARTVDCAPLTPFLIFPSNLAALCDRTWRSSSVLLRKFFLHTEHRWMFTLTPRCPVR